MATAISDDRTSTCPLAEDVVAEKLELLLRHFPTPGGQALVRRRDLPRAHAAPGPGVRGTFTVRRGVLRSARPCFIPELMRVLVTGTHGYIGSVLAPLVAERGPRGCRARYVLLPRLRLRGASIDSSAPVQRDVRDVTVADFDGFDAVVHLAALSNDPIGDLNEQWTYDINLDATLRVARAAKEAGVGRFLFASSCSMYGASGSDDLLDEGAPLQPLTAYAESKVRAEEGLAALGGDGFAIVSMRNATVYGVSPRLRLDIVLNNLAGWAHTTGTSSTLVGRAVVAAARARSRSVPYGRSRCSRRRIRSSQARRSMSARPTRTTSCGISRKFSPA